MYDYLLDLGSPCGDLLECASDQCVDGVCCDAACEAPCDACDLAGSEGTCSPRPQGESGQPSCAPYVCDGYEGACPTTCMENDDCVSGTICNGNACAPGQANGEPCDEDYQCVSSECLDGMCCDDSCTDPCEACDLSGQEGTCTLRPLGSSGDPTCQPFACDGLSPTCPTSCSTDEHCQQGMHCEGGSCLPLLQAGDSCTDDAACTTEQCVDEVCCEEPSCAPYRCGELGLCRDHCESVADCQPGHSCNSAGQCLPPQPLATDEDGGCRLGAPPQGRGLWRVVALLGLAAALRARRRAAH